MAGRVEGRVEGKVAFITGAARGQGRAHAVRLAREGADVIGVDVCGPLPGVHYPSATPEDLEETVRQVEALDRRVVSAQVDVRDLEGLKAAVDRGVAELGRLDVVVANAGICIPVPWDETSPEVFRDTLDINTVGIWNTVMASAHHVVRAGGGSIVLTSSAAGLKVQPYMVPYTTSKFAVTGMAKAFAAELAKDGVRVNSVHPTGVNTPMGSDAMHARLGSAIEGNPRPAAMFTNMLPVESTEPEDIADAVVFLASDESRQVTAHAMAVEAGVTQF